MTQDMFARLAQPFPPELVSWRVGSTNREKTKGMALAFINARDVMARFDSVCGPAGWERRHPHVGGTTTCEIAIWVEDRGWVVKCDGAGDTDVEAEKGSLSDSFKRAAVNWGVGRYLYDLPSPWVELEPAGRSYKIKATEHRKLEGILRGKGAPATAPDEPQGPSMIDVAINVLRGCSSDKGLFKETWEKNQPGWKAAMAGPDYARVVAEMKRIGNAFPKDPPPKDDLSLALDGDQIPEFA